MTTHHSAEATNTRWKIHIKMNSQHNNKFWISFFFTRVQSQTCEHVCFRRGLLADDWSLAYGNGAKKNFTEIVPNLTQDHQGRRISKTTWSYWELALIRGFHRAKGKEVACKLLVAEMKNAIFASYLAISRAYLS